jgi:type III pantothenate kinase
MSQSNIYIDIGNSAVKWRTLESDVYSKYVDEFLTSTLPQADSAWVSAVANLDIVEDIKSLFKEFHLVDSQKKCNNLVVAYDDPSSLGSDRFLAMLGAMNQFSKKPLLVIDIGSAMTFDVINGDGIHQGGLIMPGLGVLRKSFSKFETLMYRLVLMIWQLTQLMHGKVEHKQCSYHPSMIKLKNLMICFQME